MEINVANTDVDISPLSDVLGFCISRKVVKKTMEDMKDKSLDDVLKELKKRKDM